MNSAALSSYSASGLLRAHGPAGPLSPPRLQWPLLLYSDKIYSVFASPTSSGVSGYFTAIKRKENIPNQSVETSFVRACVRGLSFTEFNVIHRLCHRIHKDGRCLLWCTVVFPIGLSVWHIQRIASPIKAITFAKATLVL